MMLTPRTPPAKISAVVSDVDGTLVTTDKVLTARSVEAVAKLHARGIIFTVTSARPPRGLSMLIDPLRITTPFSSLNGGMIVRPDFSVIAEHLVPGDVARHAVGMLTQRHVDVWVFAGQQWIVRNPDGPYVGHERRTVEFEPTIVDQFGPALDHAGKIVGVSADFDLLERCEREVAAALGGRASVSRSQRYYLDITHPLANKGAALLTLADLLAIPPGEIAVIGDGANDIAMFEQSGLSIAMGNAQPDVQRMADFRTGSNNEDGFADAIERFILRGDRSDQPSIDGSAGIAAP